MSYSNPSSQNPSPAVEVVATLGDSVVGVRHVTDARSGRVTTTTRGLLIGGAIALAIGLLAFLAATRIAAANHAALAEWLARGKPGWGFRAAFVPGWMSVLSFIGLSGGLTALVAGLARRRRDLEPSTISIGSAAGVDFAVGGTPVPDHALVSPQGGIFVVDLTGMTGDISSPEGIRPIVPSPVPLPVTQGMMVRAKLGPVGFFISATEAPRRQKTPVLAMLDRRTISYLAASAAVHMALWAFARTVPPDALDPNIALFTDQDMSLQVLATNNMTVPDEQKPVDDGDGGVDGQVAMSLEAGTIGREDQNSADPARRQIMDRHKENELARKAALEAADSAGVLGSTYAGGDLFASVVGTGDVSSAIDDADIMGGFDGDGHGAPFGFGQHKSGFDVGGGGWSIKVGGYNTIRNGRDTGDGWGIPNGRPCKGVCRDHEDRIPKLGKPIVDNPGYDAEIVRRYVKRKLDRIAYCYDRQLLVNKDLEGTVMAEWTINPQGGVTGAVARGVHPEVASCIADVVASIQFPKPPAIGIFKVRYPFTLRKPAS